LAKKFGEKIGKKLAFCSKNTASLRKILFCTLFFSRKTPTFSLKIGENRRKK
jgi:hypothetical protein